MSNEADQQQGSSLEALSSRIDVMLKASIGNLKDEILKEFTSPRKRKLDPALSESAAKKTKKIETPSFRKQYNKKSLENRDHDAVKNHLKEDSKTFNPLKEEAICLDYLNGSCDLKSQCLLHHYKTPFMWQYKHPHHIKWIDWLEKANKEVEKNFCDPKKATLQRLPDVCYNINFRYTNELGCFKDDSSKTIYRRLSTRSTVYSKNEFATTWKWYWKKSDTEWEEYSVWTDSEKIEKAYISGDKYCEFTTNEFTYHIMFDEMKQQNRDERYFTKRDVIRRPEFHEVSRKSSSRLESGIVFPKTWPSKCTPGHLIDVSGPQRDLVEKSFLRSVSTPVKVIKIQEVCNEEFYEKYLVKKKQIEQKGQTTSEMLLYHGTSHDTVVNICAQNFDFRLSGKNATSYGKGSYFSRSARYSHKYSTCNSRNQYFMFLAQVLIGKYAKGDSSYTRPPPLHHGSLNLYDSCVDNMSKPSMFVVFDRDQCYPRYLITYELCSSSNSSNCNQNHLNNINLLSASLKQVNASAQPLQVNSTHNSQTQPVTPVTSYIKKTNQIPSVYPKKASTTHNSQTQPGMSMTPFITKNSQTPSGSPVKANPTHNNHTQPGMLLATNVTKIIQAPSVYPKKAGTTHNSQTQPGISMTPFITKNSQTPSGSQMKANPTHNSQTQPGTLMTSFITKNGQTPSGSPLKGNPTHNSQTQPGTLMTSFITKNSQTPSGSPLKGNPTHNSQTQPGKPLTPFKRKNGQTPGSPMKGNPTHNNHTQPGTPMTPLERTLEHLRAKYCQVHQ